MEDLNLDANNQAFCEGCGEIGDEVIVYKNLRCGFCYRKAQLLIRKLLSKNKSLKRKVRVLKDISGMLQHGKRMNGDFCFICKYSHGNMSCPEIKIT
jgi:hypothetical protein